MGEGETESVRVRKGERLRENGGRVTMGEKG